MSRIYFKAYLNQDVRRFSIPQSDISLESLESSLRQIYNKPGKTPLRFKWIDEDNDKISIKTIQDLKEAVEISQGKTVKILVDDKVLAQRLDPLCRRKVSDAQEQTQAQIQKREQVQDINENKVQAIASDSAQEKFQPEATAPAGSSIEPLSSTTAATSFSAPQSTHIRATSATANHRLGGAGAICAAAKTRVGLERMGGCQFVPPMYLYPRGARNNIELVTQQQVDHVLLKCSKNITELAEKLNANPMLRVHAYQHINQMTPQTVDKLKMALHLIRNEGFMKSILKNLPAFYDQMKVLDEKQGTTLPADGIFDMVHAFQYFLASISDSTINGNKSFSPEQIEALAEVFRDMLSERTARLLIKTIFGSTSIPASSSSSDFSLEYFDDQVQLMANLMNFMYMTNPALIPTLIIPRAAMVLRSVTPAAAKNALFEFVRLLNSSEHHQQIFQQACEDLWKHLMSLASQLYKGMNNTGRSASADDIQMLSENIREVLIKHFTDPENDKQIVDSGVEALTALAKSKNTLGIFCFYDLRSSFFQTKARNVDGFALLQSVVHRIPELKDREFPSNFPFRLHVVTSRISQPTRNFAHRALHDLVQNEEMDALLNKAPQLYQVFKDFAVACGSVNITPTDVLLENSRDEKNHQTSEAQQQKQRKMEQGRAEDKEKRKKKEHVIAPPSQDVVRQLITDFRVVLESLPSDGTGTTISQQNMETLLKSVEMIVSERPARKILTWFVYGFKRDMRNESEDLNAVQKDLII